MSFTDRHQIPLPLTANKRVWVAMIIVFAILCAVITTLFYFSEIFIVVLIGLCFIVLLNKAINLFNKYTRKYTRKQKQVLAIAIIMLVVTVGGYFFMMQIRNLALLFADLTVIHAMILQGTQLLMELLHMLPDDVAVWITDAVDHAVTSAFSQVGVILSQASLYILSIVLIYPIMLSMYFKDRGRIKRLINNAVPKRIGEEFTYTAKAVLIKSNNFFVAKVIESLLIAIICSIGFYLIGLPGWLFLGILAGLLNNIPYIGPIMATIPPVVIGFVISWQVAVLAAVVLLIAQIIDNALIVPFMISSMVDINPFTTVLLILIFSQLFGALGMILSIPIYIICKIILVESYKFLIRVYPERQT